MPTFDPPSPPPSPPPEPGRADTGDGGADTADLEGSEQAQRYARAGCQPGDRVELVFTDDPYTALRPGDQGVVTHVVEDAIGLMIGVAWDGGSTLAMRPDAGDRIQRITG